MIKFLGTVCCTLALAGCATPQSEAWWREFAGLSPRVAQYHFGWQLSGDPELAPLQVFDDGTETWLQYPAGQSVPAIFARTAAGDTLLRPRRDGDYLRVRGVHRHLLMRGGSSMADARRQQAGSDTLGTPAVPAPDTAPASVAASGPQATTRAAAAQAGTVPAVLRAVHRPSPALVASTSSVSPPIAPSPKVAPRVAQASKTATASRPPAFEVTPADGNVRRALARWARQAGWTFEPEHWAVDVDIPLAGSAEFDEPFRGAVRSLLAATELGDRPVQPCFYANQVMRVVPLAQRCDRTQLAGESS